MSNLEPDTEAGSSHDELQDGSHNTSAISFNELEEGKVGGSLATSDNEMFPNFDQVKGKESNDAKKDAGKNQGNKFPGVVLISGGSQPAFKEWVERWAHEGYAAITCDYGNNS